MISQQALRDSIFLFYLFIYIFTYQIFISCALQKFLVKFFRLIEADFESFLYSSY